MQIFFYLAQICTECWNPTSSLAHSRQWQGHPASQNQGKKCQKTAHREAGEEGHIWTDFNPPTESWANSLRNHPKKPAI